MSIAISSGEPAAGPAHAFLHKPAFKPHLHVEPLDEDRLLCLGGGRQVVLTGRAYALIAPFIDGERTSDEIVDLVGGRLSPAEAYHALLLLERKGLLEEATPDISSDVAAYWSLVDYDNVTVANELAAKRVHLASFGDVPKQAFQDKLAGIGVQMGRPAEADLWIALADDYLQPDLAGFNRLALEAGRPWLLVRPNGRVALIGPLFDPATTGCWSCLAQRLAANREVETYAQNLTGRRQPYPERGMLPSTADAALGIAATEAAKWLVTGESEPLRGRIIAFDTVTLQTQQHLLVRRPQCPDCGTGDFRAERAPTKLTLERRRKAFIADGGYRSTTPEEALRRHQHHVSPLTGIVKNLTRITAENDDLHHVYVSSNNMAVRHDSLQRLRKNVRGSCCGKGVSDAQARASALFEAVERYSGVFRGEDEIRKTASFLELGRSAIDPRACMQYSEAQYQARSSWNESDERLDWVPMPFDESAEIEWTPLWSLTQETFCYLPTGYLYYSYPGRSDQAYFLPNSNGNAAGTSIEDAILQGFLELVERDAVAVWWYNRLRRPAVDLDSFDDPFVRDLAGAYRSDKRDLWVLDVTNDLGIPAFVAVARRVDQPIEDIIFAPAAHLDPRIALTRALTELNQMLPGVSTTDGSYSYHDPAAIEWWQTATIANQPWLKPAEDVATRRRNDFPFNPTPDLREDVELCRSIVERQGLEMLVLDQTRPDIGVPVVKVVVPGLRHFWARFAPGRLYDVPVKVGWLDKPTQEADLNPIEVFI